jgi:SHS2 domain-containing protein
MGREEASSPETRMEREEGRETGVPGVETLDHTADVGIRVEAPTLAELFRRAALGSLWVATGRVAQPGSQRRTLDVEAETLPDLLRRWLREILLLQEVDGFAAGRMEELALENTGQGFRLHATLVGGPSPPDPVREIKGVTWHGLQVEERSPGAWFAQVIFDV